LPKTSKIREAAVKEEWLLTGAALAEMKWVALLTTVPARVAAGRGEVVVLSFATKLAGLTERIGFPFASVAVTTLRDRTGAVTFKVTEMLTVAPAAMLPRLQVSVFAELKHEPWLLLPTTNVALVPVNEWVTVTCCAAAVPRLVTARLKLAFAPGVTVDGPLRLTVRLAAAAGGTARVTGLEGKEGPLSPTALKAWTTNVYVAPLFSPFTVVPVAEAGAVAVIPVGNPFCKARTE
jgi:hypothetical protein